MLSTELAIYYIIGTYIVTQMYHISNSISGSDWHSISTYYLHQKYTIIGLDDDRTNSVTQNNGRPFLVKFSVLYILSQELIHWSLKLNISGKLYRIIVPVWDISEQP